jgi:hypothetical protein
MRTNGGGVWFAKAHFLFKNSSVIGSLKLGFLIHEWTRMRTNGGGVWFAKAHFLFKNSSVIDSLKLGFSCPRMDTNAHEWWGCFGSLKLTSCSRISRVWVVGVDLWKITILGLKRNPWDVN